MYDTKILLDANVNLQKSLELFGDIDTYNSTIVDFFKEIDDKLKNLKKYKELGDMSNYSILVHSLKSDSRYFGFDNFASMCEEHELKSKENDVFFVSNNFDSLIDEGIKVFKIIEKYLGVNSELSITKDVSPLKDIKGRILVVDDSNIISTFINGIFKNAYEVLEAFDGNEAISMISDPNNNIDCMLLDLNLPNVNGYEVLKYMKVNNIFPRVKVAIITGSDSKVVLENIKDYDVKAIVEKPFNETNIRNVVEKLTTK